VSCSTPHEPAALSESDIQRLSNRRLTREGINNPHSIERASDGNQHSGAAVTIHVYGATNQLTIYATDTYGAQLTYPLATVAGTSTYTIPASAGLTNLADATIQSSNDRFDFTALQVMTLANAPTEYVDSWVGPGTGSKVLTNTGGSVGRNTCRRAARCFRQYSVQRKPFAHRLVRSRDSC
jgi:hypothetical protein